MYHSASKCSPDQTKYNLRKKFCLKPRTKNNRLHVGDSLYNLNSFQCEKEFNENMHTVSAKMKSHDPRKPPTMVLIWVAAKNGLYICIAEKSSTENIDDNAKDTPLDAPLTKTKFFWKHVMVLYKMVKLMGTSYSKVHTFADFLIFYQDCHIHSELLFICSRCE